MKLQLFAVAVAMAISAPTMAVNLAVNGSFETGDFTGWNQFGDTTYTGVNSGNSTVTPTDGAFLAQFGPSNIGEISQTFADAGTYSVSFDLANFQGTFSSVDFGFTSLLTNVGHGGFAHYSFTVAVAANSTLHFAFRNPPSYYFLDNVVVELAGTTVPEPADWAMLIAGFGLTGTAMRRRRVALAA